MDQLLGSSSDDVLKKPVHGGRNLTTRQRHTIDLASVIPGWGSDLDRKNRPGVPMDKAPLIGPETLYPDFEQQIPKGRVHKSIEHAKMTPVFGNVCPPRLLSGKIRDVAFKFSEGAVSHWLLLMAADRVDVVEEMLIDTAKLQIPNPIKEMGLMAEFKYSRPGVRTRNKVYGAAAVLAAATVAVGAGALLVAAAGRVGDARTHRRASHT